MNDCRAYPTQQQTTGYIAQDVSPVAAMPRFDSIAERFNQNLDNLHKAMQRLEMLSDRLGGAAPQPVNGQSANTPEPKPNSALRLERLADYHLASTDRLHGLIDRLEAL